MKIYSQYTRPTSGPTLNTRRTRFAYDNARALLTTLDIVDASDRTVMNGAIQARCLCSHLSQ